MNETRFPYKKIGNYLKQKREHLNESLAEVSGAVEIDTDTLAKIETGSILPNEDILLLLASHLQIAESEANKLLKLAGYANSDDPEVTVVSPEDQIARQILAILPSENRITYIDQTEVRVTKNGVILNFQQPGIDGRQVSIQRIGISKQHAQKMIRLLDKALKLYESKTTKSLPAPKTTTDESTKH
jgi:transcriptional regulator with XRE-family HTH domain